MGDQLYSDPAAAFPTYKYIIIVLLYDLLILFINLALIISFSPAGIAGRDFNSITLAL